MRSLISPWSDAGTGVDAGMGVVAGTGVDVAAGAAAPPTAFSNV